MFTLKYHVLKKEILNLEEIHFNQGKQNGTEFFEILTVVKKHIFTDKSNPISHFIVF